MSDGTSALRSLLAKVAAAPSSQPAPAAGDQIGRYEITKLLGEGGFGSVYEARDRDLGRAVAIKWFRASSDGEHSPDWLAREAKAIARLSHPNIVALLDHGEHQDRPYLVLALLRGRTLADILREGRLPADRATAIGLGIARALAHAHRAGVIHLDLKPSNVMIDDEDHVTVLDFGLARFLSPVPGASLAMTVTSTASALRGAGTPAFMAPEQRDGDADARTDVFATGILLYAMLTGELPFALDAASVERVLRPSFSTLRALEPRVPRALLAIVERALAEDPDARFADGAELAVALRAVTVPARAPSRAPLVVAGVAALGCLALAIGWWRSSASSTPGATGTWSITVPARTTLLDSGIDVVANQTIAVRATGQVCTKPGEQCAGPEGQARINEVATWSLPDFAAADVGILVGKIGDQPFVLGGRRTLAAPASGRLWLGVNDRDASNNDGPGFVVTVELR